MYAPERETNTDTLTIITTARMVELFRKYPDKKLWTDGEIIRTGFNTFPNFVTWMEALGVVIYFTVKSCNRFL